MPKAFVTRAQRDENRLTRWEKQFRATTRYRMEMAGLDGQTLARKVLTPESTMRLYMREPRRIRMELAFRIMDTLRFSEDERKSLVSGEVYEQPLPPREGTVFMEVKA